ncbi:MAG: ATP-binding protein [Akkermansiaceae bacterium]|nr:ATP-binding protein [Akkermansiaceae bacterium]
MGKTSAIARALDLEQTRGGTVARADLSTLSSLADMADVVLREVTRAVAAGKGFDDFLAEILKRVNIGFSVKQDASTGVPIPQVDVSMRSKPLEEQKLAVGEVFDAIDGMAAEHGIVIGLVLDEFQEIHRFEENFSEWNLRHIIEQHENVGYVLAGSKRSLIDRMLEADGAFYRMFDKLTVGPIAEDYLVPWMEERLAPLGDGAGEASERIVALAGERTHDRMRLARHTWFRAQQAGRSGRGAVDHAFAGLVEEDADEFLRQWVHLTVPQQNVLRAVSMKVKGLSTADTLQRFALKNSPTAVQAAQVLVERELLFQRPGEKGYFFDNPYFEAWVRERTAIDLGMEPPE